MICPSCGGEMKTTHSRPAVARQVRRRECPLCHHVFFTEEKPAEAQIYLQERARGMRAFRAKAAPRDSLALPKPCAVGQPQRESAPEQNPNPAPASSKP